MADYYHLNCYKNMLTPDATQYQKNNRGMSSRYDGICQNCMLPFYRGDMIARFNDKRNDVSPNVSSFDYAVAIKGTPFEKFDLSTLNAIPEATREKTKARVIREALDWKRKNPFGKSSLYEKEITGSYTEYDQDGNIVNEEKIKDYTEYKSDGQEEDNTDTDFPPLGPPNLPAFNESSFLAKVDQKIRTEARSIESQTINLMQAAFPNMVQRAVDEALKRLPTKEIIIKKYDGPTVTLGPQHHTFETLLKVLMAQQNALLIGPMGSGKTTASQNAAKAVGINFYFSGAVTDAFQLLGYNDANGKYVPTDLYKAWTTGGLFLLDEIDGSEPSALVAFNAGLANGVMAFPCGITEKHPDFVIFAAANTWGTGATAEYVGRNRLDAATLDRFVPIEWDYDYELEMATAPNPTWTNRVQSVRKAVMREGIRVVVSPRASYQGAALLAAGMTQEQVERSVLRRTMTVDQWNRVKSG